MTKLLKSVEWFIGLRYTGIRREGHRIALISLLPTLGIAAGVMVLVTVLSVMNGFEHVMRDRILGMLSHLMVSTNGSGVVENWEERRKQLMKYSGVIGAAPYIQKEVMLSYDSEVRGVSLYGISPKLQHTVGNLGTHMTQGKLSNLQPTQKGIVMGELLANDLGLKLNDSVTLISPKSLSLDSNELPILREFKLVGTFKLDMKIYDSAIAFIHINDAATMLSMNNQVTGIRLQLDDLFKAPKLRKEIQQTEGGITWVVDWTQLNANFFKAISMQKTMMFFILILLVAVAAFNLISTLVIVVSEKESDIAILRTLGLSAKQAMTIFILQGVLIGIIGTVIGLAFGILLTLNIENITPLIEQLLGIKLISPDVHFTNKIQGILKLSDLLIISISTVTLSTLATLYPSWRASKIQPAESLRYE